MWTCIVGVPVDEKLQGTLEKRLGESFTQVSKRLEEVHRGLGEMKDLADGVGDLKRVLSNVQARGAWGEVQLRAILEQILNVEQYDENVETVPASGKRVEFAVRLPGPGDGRIEQVWLPIDSKFPMDSYARLQDAFESADAEAVATERKNLSNAVLVSAKDIRNKYVAPPHTTDIGILFLPVEGLYGEVLRDPRLLQELQSLRIVPAGPTTLAAMLSAFQMGFRTIAIEQRSAEVRSLLGKVKNEFEKFEAVLASLEKQLSTAQKTIEEKIPSGSTRQDWMSRLDEIEALASSERWLDASVGLASLTSDLASLASRTEEASEMLEFLNDDWLKLRKRLDSSGIGPDSPERSTCERALASAADALSEGAIGACLESIGRADSAMESLRRLV